MGRPPRHTFLVAFSLRADPITAHTATAAPPIIPGSPGLTWSVGGHLSHEQICGGGRKKAAAQLSYTHWQWVSRAYLPTRTKLWYLPCILFPLKDRLENTSEPSTVDFNTVSTASISHSSESLKTTQANDHHDKTSNFQGLRSQFSRSGEKFSLVFQNVMTIYGLVKWKWDADGFIRYYCKENGLQPYEGQPLEKQKKIIKDSSRGQSLSFEELTKGSPNPKYFLSCLIIPEILPL